MKNLVTSFRALHVLHIASDLFKQYGFHKVGVDRIISETKISKATFYNYFHSKERLIEMCLLLQKDTLMEKVRVEIETTHYSTFAHKLRQIYLLHANLKSAYYLLFKAIFEIKTSYPTAYQTAIRYRRWIKMKFSACLWKLKSRFICRSGNFIFMIDGTILGLLTSDRVEEQTKLLDYF